VLIRPASKVVIKFLQLMMKHGYIGEFEVRTDTAQTCSAGACKCSTGLCMHIATQAAAAHAALAVCSTLGGAGACIAACLSCSV
jgi:ribosomal protein S8